MRHTRDPIRWGVHFRGLDYVKSHDEMRMKLSPTATSLEHLKAYLNWL